MSGVGDRYYLDGMVSFQAQRRVELALWEAGQGQAAWAPAKGAPPPGRAGRTLAEADRDTLRKYDVR